MKKFLFALAATLFLFAGSAFAEPYATLKGGYGSNQTAAEQAIGALDVGYNFGQVRTEVGYIRGFAEDLKLDAGVARVLFNIPVGPKFVISPGAGLVLAQTAGVKSGSRDVGHGYTGVVEVGYKFNPLWTGVIGYEFISAGSQVIDGTPHDIKLHVASAGLRYSF